MKKIIILIIIIFVILPIHAQKTDLLKVTYDHLGSLWHSLEIETPIAEGGAGLLIIPEAGAILGLSGRIGTRDCYLDCNLLAWLGVSDNELDLGGEGGCTFRCDQLTIHWYEAFHLLVAEDQFDFSLRQEGYIDSAKIKRVTIGWDVGCLIRDKPWGGPVARAALSTKIILLEDGRKHRGWFKVGVNIDGVWVQGVIAKRLLSLASGEKIPEDFKYKKEWSWKDLERSI